MQNNLILSVFCGIDLLGKGFQDSGFCVVKAGDIILGQDVRDFKNIPKNVFSGVIGGSPCQDFSLARRSEPTGYSLEMLKQFERVVIESNVEWFLLENVPTVPDLKIEGYNIQRFDFCPSELSLSIRRKRHFQFGSKSGKVLTLDRCKPSRNLANTLTATEGKKVGKRKFSDFVQLQGLPPNWHLPDLTQTANYKVVGNAVHLAVSTHIASKIANYDTLKHFTDESLCKCGCGRETLKNRSTATDNCRKKVSLLKQRTINDN